MKQFILIVLLIMLCSSCKNEKNEEFDKILIALSKNYANSMNNSNDLECWKKSKTQFIKDSLEYKNGIIKLYQQKQDFIEFLIEKKANNLAYNNWIKTYNPCSSYFDKFDRINNQLGL